MRSGYFPINNRNCESLRIGSRKKTGRLICIAMLFLSGVAGPVRASNSYLSSAEVSSLADTAASNGGFGVKGFYGGPPFFDPISQIWSVRYMQRDERHVSTLPATFTVIVYDKSSRTEVSCLGISGIDVRAALTKGRHPRRSNPSSRPGKSRCKSTAWILMGTDDQTIW
jgi:hypothetical protein